MEQIHDRLKAELAARGLKTAMAARAVGMPDSQGLRDTLNGRKRVTADMLALLIPLGVDAGYVLTGQRSQKMSPALSAEEQTMLDYFRSASPAVRRAALGALIGAPAAMQSQHIGGANSHHSSGDGAVHIGTMTSPRSRK